MRDTLYIIDGHAHIYGSYYAIRRLSAPSGEPTNATYGFMSTLLKILRERKPDMVAVAMDMAGKTFRHEAYAAYKATRQAMPEDLPVQIERIKGLLSAAGVAVVEKEGYEADDVIGTLAKQGSARGYDVFICSKDKDVEQLLNERVVMYDVKTDEVLDAGGLVERKGIRPDQVVDVLGLMGDTSDNIPGVPGVGPKTATKLIAEHGCLEEVLAHADEVKGKVGENLRSHAESARLSKRLATIDCGVPLGLELEQLRVNGLAAERLRPVFSELGFSRLLEQLEAVRGDGALLATAAGGGDGQEAKRADAAAGGAGGAVGRVAAGAARAGEASAGAAEVTVTREEARYELVDSLEALGQLLGALKGQRRIAVDTETTAINPVAAQLVGMSFSWQPWTGYYLPFKGPEGVRVLDRERGLAAVRPILEDEGIEKTGQNLKYDMTVLRGAGVELAGVAFDTMVASYVVDPLATGHNLDALARRYLGRETIKLTSLIGKGKGQTTFDQVDLERASEYAAQDADVAWSLTERLEGLLDAEGLRGLFENVEMPLVAVLSEMEYNGVRLDTRVLGELSEAFSGRLEGLRAAIYREAGAEFNIDSTKQLAEVLFDRLGLRRGRRTKTGYSTDSGVLEGLRYEHPVAGLVLEYRQLTKLKNTYADALPTLVNERTGRVHGSFNQTVAATGRLSSSDPNLQNIPVRSELGRQIRRAFVPGDPEHEVLLTADYSQVELRMLAHFCQDASLQAAFANDEDIHQFVASQVFGVGLDDVDGEMRRRAKAINFGIIYGQTPYGLARSLGISVGEGRRFIEGYFARYPGIRRFLDATIEKARGQGYVETILGRRRQIPDIDSRNEAQRRFAERTAVNTVVQGSAADLIKVAMVNIYRRIRREGRAVKLILQVHDELVFELPRNQVEEHAGWLGEEMTGALDLNVPLKVDVAWGANWLESK